MKRQVILSGGLVVLVAVGLAVARPGGRMRGPSGSPPPGPGHGIIALLDANGDRELSAEELAAAGTALLALDEDGDGVLSPDELGCRFGGGQGQRRGMAGERPRRGVLGRDDDGDGVISQEEFLARPTEHFQEIDANSDGVVSLGEFLARPTEHFGDLDANGDGVIDGEEAKAAPLPPGPGPGPGPNCPNGRGPR